MSRNIIKQHKYTVLFNRIFHIADSLFKSPFGGSDSYRDRGLLIILLFVSTSTLAQETVAVGQIINSANNIPIASVNVFFKNTSISVKTNEEGYFMIRTSGKETTLVFSSVGYRRREIKIKSGQSIGLEVRMEEQNTLLQEIFVIPGSNPALEWMKKVRLLRKENDQSKQAGFKALSTEQNMVILSKITQRNTNNRIYDQLKKGNLSKTDSSLVIPLYMAESKYLLTNTGKKQLSKNVFSSPESGEKLLEKLLGDLDNELNFYDNSITVFGKSIVSPLSNIGNAYYDYYLTDSLHTQTGKQYEIHFRSKNVKNLAFIGKLWIDSTSLALTRIEAELPPQANINFIHNLRISQNFQSQPNRLWTRQNEEMALNMTYELLADSLHPKPEIFLKRTANYSSTDTVSQQIGNFAQSNYSQAGLNAKLNDLNNTALLRTARWLADVIFTGDIQVGKIDIGKIEKIIRLTDLEGFRLTIPLRTNERLWKNVSIGCYAGYGFKNKELKYSGMAQFRIPSEKRRIFGVNYTNDYRRIDYNYNDFIYRENPLVTGDEDISSSFLAGKTASKMSERNEFSFTLSNDWNSDIESNLYLRSNQLLANNWMQMQVGNSNFSSLQQQSTTLLTRFSFNERTYDDHLQRIYISNNKPVIYSILEVGKYKFGNTSGNYSKLAGAIKHFVNLGVGQFNYVADAGWIVGNVPYPLLEIPSGCETGGYGLYQFSLMNYMEYAADKYVKLQSELVLNGLILNQIPLIKYLNLREMATFKMAYGSLSDSHRAVLDYPAFLNPLQKPYMEVGIGFTNILHIFTLQSVWRLTDLNRPGAKPWGIRSCLSLSF